jgi:hypothetical protein
MFVIIAGRSQDASVQGVIKAKSIAPEVLVHCDCDEDGANGRLVAVNRIGARNGGKRSYLNAGTGVADNDSYLTKIGVSKSRLNTYKEPRARRRDVMSRTYPPVPNVLIPKRDDKVAQIRNQHVGYHSWQTHFRLSNSTVFLRGSH